MKQVAKALLYDRKGHVLVLRRSASHPYFAHHADFPGGEVELGEEPSAAVLREILEETGLRVSQPQLVHERQDPEEKHLIFTVQLSLEQPPVNISWEHDQHEWVSIAELMQKPIPPGVDSYYRTVIDYLST